MNYFERAKELMTETVAHRRYFHTNAEVGLHTPKACAYIREALAMCGIDAEPCGEGVTAVIGNGEKTVLLRADMDALPMCEESGEPFACPTKTEAHACGHDLHAAMLLTAAKMLKENESALKGRVKLMFQPAEETFEGARNMLQAGLLTEKVDVAMACHVAAGRMPGGIVSYNAGGTMMSSVDGFQLTIHGKGAHGAYPHLSVDPIQIGVYIYLALESLIARESDPGQSTVLTIGRFTAGSTSNIIPDSAVLQGTLRTKNRDERAKLCRRIREVADGVASLYGGSVEYEALSAVPPLVCDADVTNAMVRYLHEEGCPPLFFQADVSASASEDFALVADEVPSAYFYLSAGFNDERGDAPAHNPKVRFNEEVCPIGAACLAHCASRWLEEHNA
jgi:amidohydrolase